MNRDQLIETMARAMCRVSEWGEPGIDDRVKHSWPLFVADATAALTAIEAAGMRVVPAKLLQDLASELESEIEARYAGILQYPSQRAKYVLDMSTVERARAMLDAAQEDSTSET